MHPDQHATFAAAPGRRPPRALRCPLRPDQLWEVHSAEGLVVVAIDASALAADTDLAAPLHLPHEHDAPGGDAWLGSRGVGPVGGLNRAAPMGAAQPGATAAEALALQARLRAAASLPPRVRPLVPSANLERMQLNERWVERPLDVVGHPLGRPKGHEHALLRAVDARAVWFARPLAEGLAGSAVFVHGEWVGVSVQTSLREVPRRCARIDALLSAFAAMADERTVAVEDPGAFAADFQPFGDEAATAAASEVAAAAAAAAAGNGGGDGSEHLENLRGTLRATTAPALHAGSAAAVARASSAMAARAAVHFPDLTPLAHGTAHGRTRADDSAWWELGPPGGRPIAAAGELGTWAEDHTLADLLGNGTGLGTGLSVGRARPSHWEARESQSRGLARGHAQRRAAASHRTSQADKGAAAHAAALDASRWDGRMVAAAYKAVVDDNDEALRRIVAACAAAPVAEALHGLRGGGALNWARTGGTKVVTHFRNAEGGTLLHDAALLGSFRCAGALLELGANVGAHTRGGDTAVHRAAYHGHVSVLRVVAAFAKHLAQQRATSLLGDAPQPLGAQPNPTAAFPSTAAHGGSIDSYLPGSRGGTLEDDGADDHSDNGHAADADDDADNDEGRPFTPPTPPTPVFASLAHRLASRAHRHFWRSHRSDAGVTKAGGAAANSASSDDRGTAFSGVRSHRPTPSAAAVASAGGAADVAKAVRGLLDRRNQQGVRPVEVVARRLKLVSDFERWPQLDAASQLSVVAKFQLALAWFDEGWGLRVDPLPPPPDPAAVDPVLAFLYEPDFTPHRTRFAALPETRDLARKVAVGHATATATLHHSRYSSASGSARAGPAERSSFGGAGGMSWASGAGSGPLGGAFASAFAGASGSAHAAETTDPLADPTANLADARGGGISSSSSSSSSSSFSTIGPGLRDGALQSANGGASAAANSSGVAAAGGLMRRSSSGSGRRKATPGPRVRRFVLTATAIYDSDSDDDID
jgi:hypothetical protein